MKKIVNTLIERFGYEIRKNSKNYNDLGLYTQYFSTESIEKRSFYNISAGGHFGFGGNFTHPLWTNIDVDLGDSIFPMFDPEKDISHDPLNQEDLPLESNSAELFQSRFAIEHINDEAALKLFKEIHRALKPGGVFKVVVPNYRLDFEAYLRNDREYFWWIDMFSTEEMMKIMNFGKPLNKSSLPQVMLAHFAASASEIHLDGSEHRISDEEFDKVMRKNSFEDAMNYCTSKCSIEKQRIYRKNHINWWDHVKVSNFLQNAGFSKVVFLSPGQSVSPVMRRNPFFDRLWPEVALYAEGIK